MKKIICFLILLTLLSGAIDILAQDSDLPSPGILPDSSFYFLKSWKESIQIFFTFATENKAKQYLHLAEVRLAEYQKMVEKGKTKIAEKTLEKYGQQLNRALEKTEEAKEKGKNVQKLKEEISNKLLKHQEVLERVLEKAPEEAQKGIENAIEMSQKGFEDAIQAVTGEKKEELEKRAEEIRAKIEEKISESKPAEPGICIQVITPAISPENVCKEFPTPCDVPEGWKIVDKCPLVSPTPSPTLIQVPFSDCKGELRKYKCPDGTLVNSCCCDVVEGETKGCSCLTSPETQCPQQTPPVTRGTECPTQGETKYYQCSDGAQIPWCICGPEGSFAGAKNKWQCQYYPIGFTCPKQTASPIPTPTVGPDRYPTGKCTPGEVINYKCADGTSFKWCTCDDLGWDCPMYKYANRLCPATKETTLETGQQAPATCAAGEALNTKCPDGRIFRSCMCEELGNTRTTAWECGLEPICPQPGPPTVASVSISGAVTSDLPVELQTTPFGTVRIVWMASEPVTSRLEYGPTTSYGFTAGPDYFGSTYQGVDISNLQSNITYHFRIKIRDKDITPNTVVTEDYTFILRQLPDLAIFPISVDHFNGDTPNRIHVNIENNGVAPASKGFVVKVYVDDNLVGEGTYDSDLAAGASGEKIFDYTFPGNKSYAIIKAVVDATNLVTELNEKNNETRHDISI